MLNSRSKKLVVMADDDVEIRMILNRTVRALDCDVMQAEDGEQALELIIENQPDLVILDVMMPNISGWEVCKYIRSNPRLEKTPVVMLTAIGKTVNEMTSPLYGADVYLDKPFDIDEVCERLVRRHSRGRFASIVVVAEGSRPAEGTIELPDQTRDEYGHVRLGGIGSIVAAEIGLRTGFETRPVLLGHVQRGGTPTAFDRVLSTRFGVAAVDAAREGKWGSMVALRDNNIVTVPLAEAAGRSRTVDLDLVSNVAEMFFA